MTDTYSAAWLSWPETKKLVAAFAAYPGALRFVGGAVRDTLLSRDVKDIDAATTCLPDVTTTILQKAGIQAVPTGISHGTVTAIIDGKNFEITTLRKDTACDGRHAVVEFSEDWKEDASRRDFTMNAMYLSPEGKLFDYFEGEEDAKAGHVRFIGDAKDRIKEDYLRALRFFRFHAHYGKGAPDGEALKACADSAAQLQLLSGERIQHEIFRLLMAQQTFAILQIMRDARILDYALDIKISDLGILERLEKQSPEASVMEKLAAILTSTADCDALAERIKLSNAAAKFLHKLLEDQARITAPLPLAAQKKLLRRVGRELFESIITVSAARNNLPDIKSMRGLAESWYPPQFPVSGDDLIAIGIKPGKDMGDRLRKLDEMWEDSDYKLTKEALLGKLK